MFKSVCNSTFFLFSDTMKFLPVCIFLLVGVAVSDIDVEVRGKTRYQSEPKTSKFTTLPIFPPELPVPSPPTLPAMLPAMVSYAQLHAMPGAASYRGLSHTLAVLSLLLAIMGRNKDIKSKNMINKEYICFD